MALNAYLQQVQRLVNNPTQSLYNASDLTFYINLARGHLAGESESIRQYLTINFVAGQQIYAFTAATNMSVAGVQVPLAIRMSQVSGAPSIMESRSFEWFNQYYLTTPAAGTPTVWAPYGQGVSGSIYVNPVPTATIISNGINSMRIDTVCKPIDLLADSDPEAIPYPWTDSVPYFAAYLAYLNAQRAKDAQSMLALYEFFVRTARNITTPTVLPQQFPGGSGAALASQMGTVTGLGASTGGGGQQGQGG